MANRWGKSGNSDILFSWAPKSLEMVSGATKLKHLLLGRKTMTNLDSVLSRDITLLTKVCIVKAMFFPMNKKDQASKSWCFRSVVMEKTLGSPLECKEIKVVKPKKKSVQNIHWKDWCGSGTFNLVHLVYWENLMPGKIKNKRRRQLKNDSYKTLSIQWTKMSLLKLCPMA